MKDEFYIGWQDKAPKGFTKRTKLFVIVVLVVLPLIALGIVFSQNKFNNHVFEYGNLRTIEGDLYTNPVPFLLVDEGYFPDSITNSRAILLIGFGKHGAEQTIAEMEKAQGGSIEGKRVQLSGTLIYGDGKALFELTEGKKSLVKIKGEGADIQLIPIANAPLKIRGQILDPKCYFGVMKHGEGKVHRSCAIRCISGGVPPVLRAETIHGVTFYFVLRGVNGEPINKDILDFVGTPVEVSARSQSAFHWGPILYVNPREIKRLNSKELNEVFEEK
jgi:hypothetical protein